MNFNDFESQSARAKRLVFKDKHDNMHTIKTLSNIDEEGHTSRVHFHMTSKQLNNLKYLIKSVHILLDANIITKQPYYTTEDLNAHNNPHKPSFLKKMSDIPKDAVRFDPWDYK